MKNKGRPKEIGGDKRPPGSGTTLGEAGEEERPVRKNHYLYQSKIDMAREILGAKTETETLDAALDLLIYGEALATGTEKMVGEEYIDVLGIAGEAPPPKE